MTSTISFASKTTPVYLIYMTVRDLMPPVNSVYNRVHAVKVGWWNQYAYFTTL